MRCVMRCRAGLHTPHPCAAVTQQITHRLVRPLWQSITSAAMLQAPGPHLLSLLLHMPLAQRPSLHAAQQHPAQQQHNTAAAQHSSSTAQQQHSTAAASQLSCSTGACGVRRSMHATMLVIMMLSTACLRCHSRDATRVICKRCANRAK
jgi:hypothetical protein